MKSKSYVVIILLLVIITLIAFLFLYRRNKNYENYANEQNTVDERFFNNIFYQNENLVNESIQRHDDELIDAGVVDLTDYKMSYATNNLSGTVIFELQDKIVYLDLKYNEDLTEESYYIFDDQGYD